MGKVSSHGTGAGKGFATGGRALGITMTCVVMDARSRLSWQNTARCGALGPGDTLTPFIDLAIPVEIIA